MTLLNFTRQQCIIFQISLLFIFQLHASKAGNAVLINNGFQNVTVAISSTIKQSQQSSLINGLQTLFQAASSKMFTATGKRAYFATIIIRYPPNWSDDQLSVSASSSESESYYEADFRVANPNAAYGDLPYTQQSKGCGEAGDFIHLTPEFITDNYYIEQDYGPAENLLIHEWIKYRYGVFDENGYAFDYTYPQMYFGQNDATEYNMCNNTNVTWSTRTCHYNGDIEGLPSDCVLEAYQSSSYNEDVSSSMLSRVTLPVATSFCNNSNDHNYEAPNKQNFLCNGKAAMEVILEHEDFNDGRNSPADIYIPNPSIYQESTSENATLIAFLVWDPMTLDQTYYTAGPELLKFLYLDFPEKSYFGAIDTVDTNTPFIRLTQVDTSNRDNIYNAMLIGLRTSETPVGNVYDAVQGAIQAMQSNQSVSGANAKGIIVMSNTEYETPWDDVCSKAESNNIRLFLVTYNQFVADEFDSSSCVGLAIVVGSKTPNDIINQTLSDDEASEDILTCLVYLEQRAELDFVFMGLPAMISSGFSTPSVYHFGTYTNSTEDTFVVDVSHVDSSYFYVETCNNIQEHPPATLLTCWLEDPDTVYPYDSMIQAFFNENALTESGIWSFGVSQITTRGIIAPYTVYAVESAIPKSLSGTNDTSIEIRTWVDVSSLEEETHINGSYYLPKVRFFASVNRGTSPIFDARVQATIKNSADSNVLQVSLLDNGSGNPDITSNDGVYSSYFTQFDKNNEGSVQYFVTIAIDDNDGLATYPIGKYSWLSNVKTMDVEYSQPFQQNEFSTFSYEIPSNGSGYFPPGNIYDLSVVETQGATVTLKWTAPGANYDYGLASRYLFKCSTNRVELIEDFDELPDSEIPFTLPTTPKYIQTVTYMGINDKKTHFCAIKVCDTYDCDDGVMSNIISYYIESR